MLWANVNTQNGPGWAFQCGDHENDNKKTRLGPGEWVVKVHVREELDEKRG